MGNRKRKINIRDIMPIKTWILIIALVIMTIILLVVAFKESNTPHKEMSCVDYQNIALKDIPARCVNIFNRNC